MDASCNDVTTHDDSLPARSGARPYPQHLAADHWLRDGTRLRTRPIAPQDRRRHWRFACSLSLQTRYQRLMSPRRLLPDEQRRMVEIDYRQEMALVATAEIDGEERILGVARYVREAAGDNDMRLAAAAEFAIVVADAWQRRGIGMLLLGRLRQVAQDAGVRQLAGLTLATNTGMIGLGRRLGFDISREQGDWTVKRVTWRDPSDVGDTAAASDAAAASFDQARAGTPASFIRAQ
jgi:acetyltransferase